VRQAADPWMVDDVGWRAGTLLDGTSRRRVLAYPDVRPVFVVVGDERLDQLPQVALVQDDDMVEKFQADCSNKPLRDPILPWAPVTGARWLDAAFGKRRSEFQVDLPLLLVRHGICGGPELGNEPGVKSRTSLQAYAEDAGEIALECRSAPADG
jgi:hypothetical protein